MKKLFLSLMSLLLILSLASCNSDNSDFRFLDSNAGYATSNAEPLGEMSADWRYEPFSENESYNIVEESPFINALTSPLSTFSASPNTASYSNMRRFINSGLTPPPDSIRIEELINYFDYDYRRPDMNDDAPFSINAEVAVSPWNENNLLAMVGIQGAELRDEDRLPSNVVFLIDVSGSMNTPTRLPLVQQSFKLLVDQLSENDVISIVTYAGNDKIAADSISGDRKRELKEIIDNLQAGGSTAGSKGIQTAYELAQKNFIEGGNNRVILATDGDFNVGITSRDQLKKLIEDKKKAAYF